MTRSFIARYVSPWALRRDKVEQQRVAALRERDGENCRRCRRPLRFDLPRGHEKSPTVQQIIRTEGADVGLDNLCLCHTRCNVAGADHTDEVTERIRRKGEAELLSKPGRSASRRSQKA